MSIAIQTCSVMESRPCSFCLCLQDGSVFADFDADDQGIIALRRISFDCYGCCNVDALLTMSADDSRRLLDAIAHGDFESTQIERVLRQFFREHQRILWIDALTAHDLL